MMKTIFLLIVVAALAGCSVFEQTPDDLHEKITNPTRGHLVEPDTSKAF
jgi:hypothetical protein